MIKFFSVVLQAQMRASDPRPWLGRGVEKFHELFPGELVGGAETFSPVLGQGWWGAQRESKRACHLVRGLEAGPGVRHDMGLVGGAV